MSSNKLFNTRIGLIAATVGSAVGLGNVWRFPAETQSNGGAAFLLVYILCVFLLGIPVMLAEFALGRGGRSDAVGVFRRLSPGKPWWIVGAVSVVASYLILCYYMVVAGWTLEYLWESITGGLFTSLPGGGGSDGMRSAFLVKMETYISSDARPLVFVMLMIAVNIAVLLGGVQKGIEKLSNVLMPLLFVILVAMCAVSVVASYLILCY
ncbi:MAG: sodium-dependent transporter, partial [Muribaculaceae bacterium]|nr:sodium-dependent transporter [Muribaculaceae bacterium]